MIMSPHKMLVTLVCLLSSVIVASGEDFLNGTASPQDPCSQYTVVELSDVTLRYRSTATHLTVRLSTATQGYIGFALSPSGTMQGSEAVIGRTVDPAKEPDGVAVSSYALTSYAARRMLEGEEGGDRLTNATFAETDGGSVLQVTMALRRDGAVELNDDGVLPPGGHEGDIDGNGVNRFIWAVGWDNRLQVHRAYGTLTLTLAPCDTVRPGDQPPAAVVEQTLTYEYLFALHGALAAVAFGLLIPLAVTASRVRHLPLLDFTVRNKKAWYVLHSALNTAALLATLIAVVSVAVAYGKKGKTHLGNNAHERVGAATVLMMAAQVAAAVLRPDPYPKVEPGGGVGADPSKALENGTDRDGTSGEGGEGGAPEEAPAPKVRTVRTVWRWSHIGMGTATFGCGLYQMHSGLGLYALLFGGESLTTELWVVLACVFGALGGVVFYAVRTKR